MEPASIRTKNPGAMWGNALARKWGSTAVIELHDGLGQGNNIAVFPTYVQGICAQLDLWRTSSLYKDKRFEDAIAIWSGHNNVESYIAYVLARVPGMARGTVMNYAFWNSSQAIGFLKAQAGHEAGKTYPAPDSDWIEAQKRVMSGVVPTAPLPVPKKTIVVAATAGSAGSAGAAAHAAGAPHWGVALIVIAVVVVSTVGIILHNKA